MSLAGSYVEYLIQAGGTVLEDDENFNLEEVGHWEPGCEGCTTGLTHAFACSLLSSCVFSVYHD